MNTLPSDLVHNIYTKACLMEMEEKFPPNYRFYTDHSEIDFSANDLVVRKDRVIANIADYIYNHIFTSMRLYSQNVHLWNDEIIERYTGKIPKSPLESYLWNMMMLIH
jgi:hypothetical protein